MAKIGKTIMQTGDPALWKGNFTDLFFLLPGLLSGDNQALEDNLGFHRGRLDKGFLLLLLTEKPTVHQVTNQGYTNLSGGRVGPPAATSDEDKKRIKFSEDSRARRHAELDKHYSSMPAHLLEDLKDWSDFGVALGAVENVTIKGEMRAAKIVTVEEHDELMSPAKQYPAGKGIPQRDLNFNAKWLVAAEVLPNGDWITLPGWPPMKGEFLRENRSSDARPVMKKLLENA